MIEKSLDHSDRATLKLLRQYREPLPEALLRALIDRVQELEDAIFEALLERTIENSVGVWLDKIGGIVGWGRGELTDDQYRLAIRGKIRANRSSGTTVDMAEVATLLLPDGAEFVLRESYPATVLIETAADMADFDLDTMLAIAVIAKAVGVKLIITAPFDADNIFLFGQPSEAGVTNTVNGFSHTDHLLGGFMSHVVQS